MNPKVLDSVSGNFDNNRPDSLIWEGNAAGTITTSSFMKTIVPSIPKVKKFDIIWQSWLPPKISCFLWKIIHGALPTKENLMRLGFHIVSKCFCCKFPKDETTIHVLLHSDFASTVFDSLCPVFRKKRPISLHQFFYDWGISADFSRFSDCLAFGLVCCSLWEIWKKRNSIMYGDSEGGFCRGSIYKWVPFFSKTIKAAAVDDALHSKISCCLHISMPIASRPVINRRPWSSSSNVSACHIAIRVDPSFTNIAAIVRSSNGSFIAGLKLETLRQSFFKSLRQVLHELKRLGVSFGCVKTDNLCINLLSKDINVEWSHFRIKLQLMRLCRDMEIFRIYPTLNCPATALCWSRLKWFFTTKERDLPRPVLIAIAGDQRPKFSSIKEHRIFI